MGLHPRVWVNGIVGVMRPWEMQFVGAILANAPAQLAPKLKAQVKLVTLVQREDEGRIANLYSTDRLGRVLRFPPKLLLEMPERSEAVLARGELKMSGAVMPVIAHVAGGRLFSLSLLDSSRRADLLAGAQVVAIDVSEPVGDSNLAACIPADFCFVSASDTKVLGLQLNRVEDVYATVVGGVPFAVLGLLADGGALLSRATLSGTELFWCTDGEQPEFLGRDMRSALFALHSGAPRARKAD